MIISKAAFNQMCSMVLKNNFGFEIGCNSSTLHGHFEVLVEIKMHIFNNIFDLNSSEMDISVAEVFFGKKGPLRALWIFKSHPNF